MISIINPATEQLIEKMPTDDEQAITLKYQRAAAFRSEWRAVPLAAKCEAVMSFAGALLSQVDRLSELLSAEMGKPIKQARGEIKSTAQRLAFFVEQVPGLIAEQVMPGTDPAVREILRSEPLGVIANISAWNYPYFVGTNVFIPALLTGNCVLYKPSEFALLSGRAIAELLRDSSIPPAAFQVIYGDGQAGRALLQQPVDGVFFTGSKATGLKIAAQVRERMIPLQLELGGKDPTYVADDANLERAAESLADGAFYNAGQSCCSVERIYVHEKVYQEFLNLLTVQALALAVGNPLDRAIGMGPLTRKSQLDVLESQVADAQQKGARLLCGGARISGPGYFFSPTIVADADHSMSCMRDESFGPIVAVQSVKDDAEALEKMNDTEYGLTAGVYSGSSARAEKILAEVNAGTVYVNCCDRVSPFLPWSGRKHSGIGCTMSSDGLRAFVKPKAWHLKA